MHRKEKKKHETANFLESFMAAHSHRIDQIEKGCMKIISDQDKSLKTIEKVLDRLHLPDGINRDNVKQMMIKMFEDFRKNPAISIREEIQERIKALPEENHEEESLKILDEFSDCEKYIEKLVHSTSELVIANFLSASEEKKEKEFLRNELEKYKKLSEEYLEMSRTLKKDYTRLKERTDREKEELVENANQKLFFSLLEVLDNLDAAVKSFESDRGGAGEAHFRGVEMVAVKMKKIFNDAGVLEMEVENSKFDPQWHEALMQDNESCEEEGTVTLVYRKGYIFKEKLLRSALVGVSTGAGKRKTEEKKST